MNGLTSGIVSNMLGGIAGSEFCQKFVFHQPLMSRESNPMLAFLANTLNGSVGV